MEDSNQAAKTKQTIFSSAQVEDVLNPEEQPAKVIKTDLPLVTSTVNKLFKKNGPEKQGGDIKPMKVVAKNVSKAKPQLQINNFVHKRIPSTVIST